MENPGRYHLNEVLVTARKTVRQWVDLSRDRLYLWASFDRLNTCHTLEEWLSWVDELSHNDFVIVDNFLDPQRFSTLRHFFLSHLEEFTQAGIGALGEHTIRQDIRGDYTYWLDRKRDSELHCKLPLKSNCLKQNKTVNLKQ